MSSDPGDSTIPRIVDRMPPEILVNIFQLVQWATGWQSYTSQTTPAWISFTWVCRRWRDVALSAPLLWTSIRHAGFPRTRNWLPVFLERTAGAPLDVDIALQATDDACVGTLQTIQPYSPTIRRFRLRLDNPEEDVGPLVSPLIEEMRNVEELTLLTVLYYGRMDAGTINASRNHLPQLTSLHLSGLHIPWSSSVYTGLRSLRITSAAYPPSTHEFFEILRGCPDLEVLHFGIRLPATSASVAPESSFSVLLPRMRQILLKGTTSEVDSIAQYVELPPSCSVDLLLRPPYQGPPLAALVPKQLMLQPLLRTCTTFSLSVERVYGPVYLYMQAGKSYLHISCLYQASDDIFVFDSATWTELLNMLRHSPVIDVSIALDVVFHMGPEMWLQCFSTFPLLESVAFGPNSRTVRDCSSFLTAIASPTADGASDVVLARLRVLQLTYIRLDNATVENILSMLDSRTSGGAPLPELEFKGCYCDRDVDVKSFAERLRKRLKLSIRYARDRSARGSKTVCDEFRYDDSRSS
ncbi:hypothetical protein C8T65DRAFT_657307 [Cerioporus squamosus]|nr:hypothetical protein C8T65DRAFT_657307 [Cerioporus squamosus]